MGERPRLTYTRRASGAPYSGLSKAHKRISDFIMDEYYNVAMMSSRELAEKCGTDPTTVVRFCQRVGYTGYPDLRSELQERVRDEVYRIYHSDPNLDPFSPYGIFLDTLSQEARLASLLRTRNSQESIEQMASMLDQCTQVLVIGEGYASFIAEATAERFRHMGMLADYIPNDAAKIDASMRQAGSSYLLIAMSAERQTDVLVRALVAAKSFNCPSVLIASNPSGQAASECDLFIRCPSDSKGEFPSISALSTTMDVVTGVWARYRKEAHLSD